MASCRRVVLAGAAGVGKTTVAGLLSRLAGLPHRHVEAARCWPIAGPRARQLCFLSEFAKLINGYGVFDNSLLSVYAYSMALGLLDAATVAIAVFMKRERLQTRVVVLTAEPGVIGERIEARLASEKERSRSIIEKRLEIHARAQRYLVEAAEELGLPVVDTSGETPDAVARRVLELLNVQRSGAKR